jgi:hypothetical protein
MHGANGCRKYLLVVGHQHLLQLLLVHGVDPEERHEVNRQPQPVQIVLGIPVEANPTRQCCRLAEAKVPSSARRREGTKGTFSCC